MTELSLPAKGGVEITRQYVVEHGQDHVFCRKSMVALRSEDRHAEAHQDEVGVKQAAEDLK